MKEDRVSCPPASAVHLPSPALAGALVPALDGTSSRAQARRMRANAKQFSVNRAASDDTFSLAAWEVRTTPPERLRRDKGDEKLPKTAYSVLALALLCLCAPPMSDAASPATSFTYQGRLNEGANPGNGLYDFQFSLFDAPEGGNQIGVPLVNLGIGVFGGLFTTTLDFGAGVFTGTDRWLDIAVRTNGATAFTTLWPRQPVTPTPYAVYAASAGTAASSTTNASLLTTGTLPTNIFPAVLPPMDGSHLTGVIADVSYSGQLQGTPSITRITKTNLYPVGMGDSWFVATSSKTYRLQLLTNSFYAGRTVSNGTNSAVNGSGVCGSTGVWAQYTNGVQALVLAQVAAGNLPILDAHFGINDSNTDPTTYSNQVVELCTQWHADGALVVLHTIPACAPTNTSYFPAWNSSMNPGHWGDIWRLTKNDNLRKMHAANLGAGAPDYLIDEAKIFCDPFNPPLYLQTDHLHPSEPLGYAVAAAFANAEMFGGYAAQSWPSVVNNAGQIDLPTSTNTYLGDYSGFTMSTAGTTIGGLLWGTNSPEGVVRRNAGWLFVDIDPLGAKLWLKLTGTSNSLGWLDLSGAISDSRLAVPLRALATNNGAGLTALSANAITGGLTTNIAVLVPGGRTCTLHFTNGVLRVIE